ncbi:hypothetical protein J1N35_000641 [Gossypium stocksii]|uniref:Uncharacterized protein n=1 Tax=Gossypium stocksii TaxID=47602 RepID=A0A9D3WIR9_9ROSI|nr:hypothetical protein J1N35_000641 [Gossypium stocksii]
MEGPSNKGVFGTIVEDGVAGALVKFVGMGGEAGKLFYWCEHLGTREFPYSPNNVTNHLMVFLLEVTKDCTCLANSSNGVKKLSLQVLLAEDSMVGLGFNEGISGVEVSKREYDNSYQNVVRALKRACELHSKLKKKNKDLWRKNKGLAEPLVVIEGKAEKLFEKVAVEKQKKKKNMDASMKMVEKY